MDRHLIHTCNVERFTWVSDPHANQEKSWSSHLTGQRCRLITRTQRALNTITAQFMVQTTYRLLVPFAADVAAGDRVNGLTLEDGTAVGHTFEVLSAMPRRGAYSRHLSLELGKVE